MTGAGLIRQRGDHDCGICALGMYAQMAYEDVYVAVAAIDPATRGKGGLHNHEIIRAAARLGLTLEATRRFDLDDEDGVLRVRWNGRKGTQIPGGHFVAVRDGQVLCPTDDCPQDWRAYLKKNRGRACTLLREVHR